MIQQVEITLSPKSRGFHLVTSEVMRQLPKLPMTKLCYIILAAKVLHYLFSLDNHLVLFYGKMSLPPYIIPKNRS